MTPLSNTYSCFIADDNEIDRLTTLAFAKKYSFLNITGIFENATDAFNAVSELKPQVLLLDIDMGETSGLQLRRELMSADACIFITAYPDYALESFEVAALDFLVKPIKAERFDLAMNRLYNYLQCKHKAHLFDYSLNGDTVFIKDGHVHIKIRTHEILYLEALKDYTGIVTPARKYCVLASLGNLLNNPSFGSFIRVHRSYAVQKHFVDKITPYEVVIGDSKIPVGRSYKTALEGLRT